ncbi:MAG: molybdenum cofactor biosynthesis protein MoaE [Maricaulaceae bacterium]
MSVTITPDSFDPEAALKSFRETTVGAGAIVSFTGIVRHDDNTQSLTLTHYPGMTENEISTMGQEASRRWDITAWQVIHRVGEMTPKDPIVFVAAASVHRRAAFEAADFLMDYLKSRAPLWKKEQTHMGEKWIEPRAQDAQDILRWD